MHVAVTHFDIAGAGIAQTADGFDGEADGRDESLGGHRLAAQGAGGVGIGVVEAQIVGYLLTASGQELEPILFGLGEWGARWTFGEPRQEELDPGLLVWWMHSRLDTSSFPGKRHVFAVRFRDEVRRYWIVVESGIASVCVGDPGYRVDVTITADMASLYQVWLGRMPLSHAVRTGRVEFAGPSALTRRMPSVLKLSPVAPYSDSLSTLDPATRAS